MLRRCNGLVVIVPGLGRFHNSAPAFSLSGLKISVFTPSNNEPVETSWFLFGTRATTTCHSGKKVLTWLMLQPPPWKSPQMSQPIFCPANRSSRRSSGSRVVIIVWRGWHHRSIMIANRVTSFIISFVLLQRIHRVFIKKKIEPCLWICVFHPACSSCVGIGLENLIRPPQRLPGNWLCGMKGRARRIKNNK